MKDILFITNYRGMFPFIQSFSEKLSSLGYDVYIFDTEEFRIFKNDKLVSQNKTFLKLCKLPKICVLIKQLLLYISILRLKKFDIINILYLQNNISGFGKLIKEKGRQLNIIYAGNDLYRANKKEKTKAIQILNSCDNIILVGDKHKNQFNTFYKNRYDDKIRFVGIGLDELDTIDVVNKDKTIFSLKNELGIPINKKIVTIGYNGIKEQQHFEIIYQLKNLNKENICIILPMTYGLTTPYKNQIENLLNKYEFDYIIFDKYLEKNDIAIIRIVSDIVLNFQISDGASRSLMEHLYAENIVIVGDWLPYDFWDDMGIYYHQCKINNIGVKLKNILNNFDAEHLYCEKNKRIIRDNWAWDGILFRWVELFNTTRKS